jgi:hypothetical protein
MIRRPELRQFAQRVVASFHLTGMDRDTVAAYIAHRLRVAGGQGNEFTKQACERVYEASRGIPRLVNQLCDFCYGICRDGGREAGSVLHRRPGGRRWRVLCWLHGVRGRSVMKSEIRFYATVLSSGCRS